VTDQDMDLFGYSLSVAYNELVDSAERKYYTERLRERRGVMTIHDFYSNILQIDCDTDNCRISEEQWYSLDHSCLKTAVNGAVFRDDLGQFTAFRELLLGYYPDKVWKRRIAEQLHEYSAALQVNYARCMARGDTVAAEICRIQGLRSAMELYFLLKRTYSPYYKWTYQALRELEGSQSDPIMQDFQGNPARPLTGNRLDAQGEFSGKIRELADTKCDPAAWEGTRYHPNRPNFKDRIISLAEEIASEIADMLIAGGLTDMRNYYLESYASLMID
nr:DUF4037 domain-containing protein [Lachnospiraceae bacterium]